MMMMRRRNPRGKAFGEWHLVGPSLTMASRLLALCFVCNAL